MVNRVILVCTPNYAVKANAGKGGVGYEKSIVTGEMFSGAPNSKFIPLLRNGTFENAMPAYLKSRYHIDFRNDAAFNDKFEELLRDLHGAPMYRRPELGTRPSFIEKQLSQSTNPERRIIYCNRCGALPGSKSTCTRYDGRHEFVTRSGTIYCRRCGVTVGDVSKCTHYDGHHDFVTWTGSGTIYCRRCGATIGELSRCTHYDSFHDFSVWSGTGTIFCEICGETIGKPSACTHWDKFHSFVSR